jgi:hypothetical protein
VRRAVKRKTLYVIMTDDIEEVPFLVSLLPVSTGKLSDGPSAHF